MLKRKAMSDKIRKLCDVSFSDEMSKYVPTFRAEKKDPFTGKLLPDTDPPCEFIFTEGPTMQSSTGGNWNRGHGSNYDDYETPLLNV